MRTLGKYNKIILGVVGVIGLAYLIFGSDGEKTVTGYVPPSNVFEIGDFEMLTGREGGNYRLTASRASFNRLENIAELDNIVIKYDEGEVEVSAKADKGFYLENRYLVAEGNIDGTSGDLAFKTDESGILNYDLELSVGTVENNVTFIQGNNLIKADKAVMDLKSGLTEFKGNVSVSYTN
jgi:LPS export ABC transporter protein LptC